MTAECLRRTRSQRFHDAIDFKKTDRVPNLACVVSWKILDAGYRFQDAFYDHNIMEKCVRHFVEHYQVDAISDPGSGCTYQLMQAFGEDGYFRLGNHRIDVEPFSLAEAEELKRYCRDRDHFLFDTLLPRKFPDWSGKTVDDFQRALRAAGEIQAYAGRISSILNNEYGMPLLSSTMWGTPTPLVENLIHPVRGVRGLSMDIHRMPEVLDELIDEVDSTELQAVIRRLETGPQGHDFSCCFDMRTVIRSSSVLSRKQFERFYWQSMKPVFDACAKYHKHILVMIEGPGAHIYDLFSDYPKGIITMMVEHDDPIALRQQLPNVAIAGGMPLTLLGYADKNACVARARELVETLASEGGYIFCENNFMCYPNDARAENLKAVCDFLANGGEA